MITAVDTNILLDILIPNQKFLHESLQKMESAAEKGQIVICEIVYSELASQFNRENELKSFLTDTRIEILWCLDKTLFQASQLWQSYRKTQEQHSMRYFCPECGNDLQSQCPNCGVSLNKPRRILNDFIIGAHAEEFSDVFLTRDRGFYREYFTKLTIG